MSSTSYPKVLFVNTSQPTRPGSIDKEQRRIASVHAARTAHARVRLRRTSEFQASKSFRLRERLQNDVVRQNGPISGEDVTSPRTVKIDTPSTHLESTIVLPDPLNLVPANSNGSHEGFPTSLEPLGRLLFHHCKFSTSDTPKYQSNRLPAPDINSVIPWLITHCKKLSEQSEYAKRMSTKWVRLALTSEGFFNGILLVASRHLSMMYKSYPQRKHKFTRHAMQYKVSCLQSLSASINTNRSSKFGDSTLAQVMVLAQDEVYFSSIWVSYPTFFFRS